MDVRIAKEGRAGRITLTRPQALNALTHEMCEQIDAALVAWANDPEVALILLEGEGPRAFCAGGDVAAIYRAGIAGDFALGRRFWTDEYRMNVRIAEYPKPVVSFLHGFVLGGGVGLGAQGSHRIVGESVQVSMPECGIGLIPDVGGTHRLARAPGRAGEYLGLTGTRMGPGDAITANFADLFVPEADWQALKAKLVAGDLAAIDEAAVEPPEGRLAGLAPQIDRLFAAPDVAGILAALEAEPGDFAAETLTALRRNSPLSMATTLAMIRSPAAVESVRSAIVQEYRAVWRLVPEGDFLEGVRAQIIDKDRQPRWHATPDPAPMLAPLGDQELDLEGV